MSEPTAPGGQDRPAIAIVSNSHSPYRLHLLRRIAREMPEIRLWSVFTHETVALTPWTFDVPSEISPISFGQGECSTRQQELAGLWHEWRKGGRIIRWMGDQRIRAVVLSGYNDTGRLRILRWCRAHGVPCLIWADSNIRDDHVRGFKRLAKNVIVPRILRESSGSLVCGAAGRAFMEKYSQSPDRIFSVPLVPDHAQIRALSADAVLDVARRFHLAAGRRRIVFSGRLIPLKRLDHAIDAFAAVAPQRPEWDLLIVGDGPLRQDLEQRVPPALRHRVTWAGFVSDQIVVSALYRASDLLLLCSNREAWSLVLLEAAAAGLAIVSSSIPGAATDVVREGTNGHVYDSGDFPALVDCLSDATQDARIDAMKKASIQIYDEWLERTDPIDGLRSALQFSGVLGMRRP
jgi:glycosyltransferase involved in cell wall biosynthesis